MSSWEVGDVVDDLYEVREVIASGGMGRVHRVWHRGWDVELAVKTPRPELVESTAAVRDFVAEAQTWVNLGAHPNVVPCVYVREVDGYPRIFAEWADGGSLSTAIRSGRLYEQPGDVLAHLLDTAIQFAWGLEHAHSCGLVHQDVKPANLMLTSDGMAKVCDFGLSRARAAGRPTETLIVTHAGGLTPAYCSPEQAVLRDARQRLTRATDAWSWAISVWEMFHGSPPCLFGQVAAQAFAQYVTDPGAPKAGIPPMPAELQHLLRRCLDPEPRTRFRHMSEIADHLIAIYRIHVGAEYGRERPAAAMLAAGELNNHALSLIDLGQTEQAERMWSDALAQEPGQASASYNYALHRWRHGAITDEHLVDQVLSVRRSSKTWWPAPLFLGLIELERGDPDAAREWMTGIEHNDPPVGPAATAALKLADNLRSPRPPAALARIPHTRLCVVSHDFRSALTSDAEPHISVWKLATSGQQHILAGHTGHIKSLAVDRAGAVALSAGADGTVRLWDVTTGQSLRVLPGHDSDVTATLSNDGRTAAAQTRGTVRLWDTGSGRLGDVVPGSFLAFSRDNRLAAIARADHAIVIVDVVSGATTRTLAGHTDVVTCALFAHDRRTIFSAGRDRTLHAWDLRTGNSRHSNTGHPGAIETVRISGDGRLALTIGTDCRVWDTATLRWLRTLCSTMTDIVVTPDGRFAVSTAPSVAQAWDIRTGQCLHTTHLPTGARGALAVSPDGRLARLGLTVWEVPEPGPKATWSYERPRTVEELKKAAEQIMDAVTQVNELLAGGQFTAAASALRSSRTRLDAPRHPQLVELWQDLGRRAGRRTRLNDVWPLHTLTGHTGYVTSGVVDEERGIAATCGGTIKLWDLRSGRCLRTIDDPGRAYQVLLSAEGTAMSCARDETLRVWDGPTGRLRHELRGQTRLGPVELSPDGRWAVSGSAHDGDATVAVWDLHTGTCVHVLRGHTRRITAVALDSDTNTTADLVYATAADGTVRVWNLTTGRPVKSQPAGWSRWILGRDGIAVAHNPDGELSFYDLRAGRPLLTIGLADVGRDLDTGDELVASAGALFGWYLTDGAYVTNQIADETATSPTAVVADLLAVFTSANGHIRLRDVRSGEFRRGLFGHAQAIHSVSASAGGNYLVSTSFDNSAIIWQLDWEYDFYSGTEVRRRILDYVTQHPLVGPLSPSSDHFTSVAAELRDLDISAAATYREYRAVLSPEAPERPPAAAALRRNVRRLFGR